MTKPVFFSRTRRVGAVLSNRPWMDRINTDVICRLTLALLTLFTPYSALVNPDSVPGRMVRLEGISAYPVFVVMFVISFAIITDVAVNSVGVPPKLQWRWLTEQRTAMYGIAAFCAIIAPYTVAKASLAPASTFFLYFVIFFDGVGLLWCDAVAKREGRCVPAH